MTATPVIDVTVLVPTYNRAHYLGECLSALVTQSVRPRQILIIDDGSTDDTAAVAASYGSQVDYIRQPNGGKASALNLGLANAVGADIWICDDDDIVEPEALSLLHAALHRTPGADFAFGHYDNFSQGADGSRQFEAVDAPRFDEADLACALLERCFVFQAALLVRRACYDRLGGFDTDFIRAQDYEMLTRLVRGSTGVHVPEVMFHQRQHDERRGTAAHVIDGALVWEKQKLFDAQVLEKVHRTFPLSAYLPRPTPGDRLTPAQTVDALLRRASVTARKKLWSLAVDDITSAAALAREHGITRLEPAEEAIVGRIFDEYSYARDDLGVDNPLLRQIGRLPAGPFRKALIASLTWPIFRYILLATRRGQRGDAIRYVRLYSAIGSGGSLPHHLMRLARKSLSKASAPSRAA